MQEPGPRGRAGGVGGTERQRARDVGRMLKAWGLPRRSAVARAVQPLQREGLGAWEGKL